MNKLLVVILLIGFIPLSVAQEENNTITVEVGTQFPCNPSEDPLGCAYRALLDTGVLEHPIPLEDLRIAFNMTEPEVMRFI